MTSIHPHATMIGLHTPPSYNKHVKQNATCRRWNSKSQITSPILDCSHCNPLHCANLRIANVLNQNVAVEDTFRVLVHTYLKYTSISQLNAEVNWPNRRKNYKRRRPGTEINFKINRNKVSQLSGRVVDHLSFSKEKKRRRSKRIFIYMDLRFP